MPTFCKVKIKDTDVPGFALLKKWVSGHPETPFLAVAGGWNGQENNYDYESLPLSFDGQTIEAAQGKQAYYHYQLTDTTGHILRAVAAIIPATPRAVKHMDEWMRVPEGWKPREAGKKAPADTLQKKGKLLADPPANCWMAGMA